VAELMRQRARPILAQVAARLAIAVPDRAHVHLARLVDDRGTIGVGTRRADDPALVGVGAQAVGGVDADVRVVPVRPILVDRTVRVCTPGIVTVKALRPVAVGAALV
jgi:hypothetical protein